MSLKTIIILLILITTTSFFIPTALAFQKMDNEKVIDNSIDLKAYQSNVIEESSQESSQSTPKPTAIEPTSIQVPAQPTVVARQPIATTSPKPVIYNTEYIKKRICEVWGQNQCRNALIIAQHESGFNLMAVSPTNDYGVMQVNCRWHISKVGGDCTRLFDLETNLRIAKQIYDASGGWGPWSTKIYL